MIRFYLVLLLCLYFIVLRLLRINLSTESEIRRRILKYFLPIAAVLSVIAINKSVPEAI